MVTLVNKPSAIDAIIAANLADKGKEHGRTLQLGVAIFESHLNAAALISGKSEYKGKSAKGKVKDVTPEREQRRLALIDLSPTFKDVFDRASGKKKSMFAIAVSESDKNAASSSETMFYDALFVAYALEWMGATDLKLSAGNKILKINSQRHMNDDGTENPNGLTQMPAHLAVYKKAGKNAAILEGLIEGKTPNASGGAGGVVSNVASSAGGVSAAIQKMTPEEKVELSANVSTKEGLMALIEACYVAGGVLNLNDLVADIRVSNHFKDKISIEGRVVAEIQPGKKSA